MRYIILWIQSRTVFVGVLDDDDESTVFLRIKAAYSNAGTSRLKRWANEFFFSMGRIADSRQVAPSQYGHIPIIRSVNYMANTVFISGMDLEKR